MGSHKFSSFVESYDYGRIATDFEGRLWVRGVIKLHERPDGSVLIYIKDRFISWVKAEDISSLDRKVSESLREYVYLTSGDIESINRLIKEKDKLEADLEQVVSQLKDEP